MALEEFCNKENPIKEGKTKIIYPYKDSATEVVMFFKDAITAGDGDKKDTITGKGLIDAITNANIFKYLNAQGVPTHFISVDEQDPRYQLVKKLERAIPLEVVARRVATGSFLKRHPEAKEGDLFQELIVEFFYKDDDLHDPMLDPIHIEVLSKKTPVYEGAAELVRSAFQHLEKAFAKQNHQLIDMKIEVGYPVKSDTLVITDELTTGSFRLWPYSDMSQAGLDSNAAFMAAGNVMDQLNKGGMLDKQLYREEHPLAEVKEKFERVKVLTDNF